MVQDLGGMAMEFTDEKLRDMMELLPGNCVAYLVREQGMQFLAATRTLEPVGGLEEGTFRTFAEQGPLAGVMPGDRARVEKALADCSLPTHRQSECICRVADKQGETHWVRMLIRHAGVMQDTPVVVVSFADASEQMDAQLELLEEMDTLVFVCDAETEELLYANRAAVQSSLTKGDYAGKTCHGYMFGHCDVCADCQLKSLKVGSRQELVRHVKENDSYLNIEKKGISWYGRLACAHFITDVTAKKQNEKLLAAERESSARAAFVTNVSHDMRTPLNGILGFTDMAIHSSGEQKKSEYLAKIQSTGKFMLSLINDTLDFSKISDGKLELEPEDTDVKEMLESVLTPIRSNAELNGVQFRLELEDMGFEHVFLDGLKMQKIILNLLSNAVKFTPKDGTVTLSIEGPREFGDGNNCHIVVSDTGIGMEPEFLPKIFTPFSQERNAKTKKIKGTGLGMAIVKQLVTLMGGRIEVQSEPGKGTRFDIWMTWQEGAAAGIPADRNHAGQDFSAALQGHTVLVCDDDELNREIAGTLLEHQGMKVLYASDGSEAVSVFSDSEIGSIHIILMDVHMPIMDGYEVTKAIRDMSRVDAKFVPIFALSGDGEEKDIELSMEAGMNGHLLKPIEPSLFYGELARALQEAG